ncbi:MAG TPA: branched-chain amino acid ABC transporter permease [Actinomycetota bacterium]|nr:branched-chain amino acid ABC transporter permease [Actinomycetota bacterium]
MNLPSWEVVLEVAVVGLMTGGVYSVMVSGLSLIFGVMRVINVAHGAFLVLAAYLAYWTHALLRLDPLLSVFVSAPAFFVLGMILERGLLARTGRDPGLTVLVTFALAIVIAGVIGWAWETTPRAVRTTYTDSVVQLDLGGMELRIRMVRLLGMGEAIAVVGPLYAFLRWSDMGRAIRATMQNAEAAQLVGINLGRVRAVTFGLGLATVAAGGAMFALNFAFNPSSHEEWISKMLSIVVLGGLGSLPGALIAAIVMGVVEAIASVTITTYLSPIVFYLLLFVVLIVRPEGLMGARVREA